MYIDKKSGLHATYHTTIMFALPLYVSIDRADPSQSNAPVSSKTHQRIAGGISLWTTK